MLANAWEIRSAGREDVPAVLALWQRARGAATTGQEAAALERLLATDPGALLVAVDDALVGTLIAAWDGWRGGMYRLTVDPDHRRQGLARALVAAGDDRLRALGARRVTALVDGSDPSAIAVWEAAGYRSQRGVRRYVKDLASP